MHLVRKCNSRLQVGQAGFSVGDFWPQLEKRNTEKSLFSRRFYPDNLTIIH